MSHSQTEKHSQTLAIAWDVLPPEEPGIDVIILPHIFRPTERIVGRVPVGWTIQQIIDAAPIAAPYRPLLRVWLNEEKVPEQYWGCVRPKAGTTLGMKVIPEKGGGGGKSIIMIVLKVVAIVAAIVFQQYWIAAALALSLVGDVLNMLAPSPSPLSFDMNQGDGEASNARSSITGSQNRTNLYGAIPIIFGTRRVYPPLGARSYTEWAGGYRYFRMLFTIGYGPLQIEDIRIGDTPIGAFADAEIEVRQGYPSDEPLTLYTNKITEESLAVLLKNSTGWQQRTTKADIDEISIDYSCARGLTFYTDAGGRNPVTVQVETEYSPTGANTWSHPTWADADEWLGADGIITITDNSTSAVSRHGRWTVAKGQYDVRFRRVTADATSDRQMDLTYVTALRSIFHSDPITMPGLAKIALRIREGGQISGVVQQLSCIATAILPDWDTDTQTWIERATRSPAAAFRAVFAGPANERRVDPATRLHLASIQDWSEACAAQSPQNDGPMWTFDAVIESFTTAFELARNIAATARASIAFPDGKFGVVRDIPQTTPVQNFTPRNTWDYKGARSFDEIPHALKVRFTETTFWEQDEVIVYDDGYNEDGTEGLTAASIVEVVDYTNCTSEKQAWREGRYQLASRRLRPGTHKFSTDFESLRCTQGDLVMLSHDVAMIGLATGRVKSLLLNEDEDRVTGVVIDEIVTMTTSKTYSARFRKRSGDNLLVGVTPINGDTSTLMFTTSVPIAEAALEKALVQFGETDLESAAVLVKSIQRQSGFTAILTVVDAAPEVHQADQGPIPAYNPRITKPFAAIRETPPVPRVSSIRSDESVLVRMPNGSLSSRIVVNFQPDEPGAVLTKEYEGQLRAVGARDWIDDTIVPSTALELAFQSVEDKTAYELRFRSRNGVSASDWTATMTHTVVGQSTNPPSPTSLLVERLPDDTLRYRWTHVPPIDHWGYRIRWNHGVDDVWSRGTPAHDPNAPISVNWFETKAFAARAFTVMVKAVDECGNESDGVAIAVVNLGDAIPLVVMDTTDFGALGWAGTITGGTIVSGVIEADAAGVLYTDPNQPLFLDPSQDLFSTFDELILDIDWRPERRGFLRLTMDADGAAVVQYRTLGAAPLYTNPAAPLYTDPSTSLIIASPYVEYLGPMEVLADVIYQIRVTIPGGGVQGVIRSLVADIELPTDTENLNDVVISAGGTRIITTKSWEEIINISITVQEAVGYDAIRVHPVDKDAVLGPLLRGYDTAGDPADALVDITIQGIPAV